MGVKKLLLAASEKGGTPGGGHMSRARGTSSVPRQPGAGREWRGRPPSPCAGAGDGCGVLAGRKRVEPGMDNDIEIVGSPGDSVVYGRPTPAEASASCSRRARGSGRLARAGTAAGLRGRPGAQPGGLSPALQVPLLKQDETEADRSSGNA